MASKQEYYRRLMKEKKSKSSSIQRIDHPLARYNQLDQLSCVVCSSVVKSELLWQTHLQSKQHKEKITELKSLKKSPHPTVKSSSIKSSAKQQNSMIKSTKLQDKHTNPSPSSQQKLPAKRHHSSDDTTEEHSVKKKIKESSTSVVKPDGLPTDFFDESNEQMETNNTDNQTSAPKPLSSTTDLPPDFFDPPSQEADADSDSTNDDKEPSEAKVSVANGNEKPIEKQENEIPEGFFDDPKLDAKKRNVEFKDPQDTAWEDFQKTISKETEVSEAIVEKGDELMQDDRELAEVNEQVACYQKAEELRLKQEQLRNLGLVKKEPITNINDKKESRERENSTDEDELDFDELSNWRFSRTT